MKSLRLYGMSPARIYVFVAMLTGFVACIKAPEYPIEPVLTLAGISTDTMRQGSLQNDSIIVHITLTDGDGDIGSDDGFNATVIDLRDNFPAGQYRLPKVQEVGANNGISADLWLTIYTTCCVFPNGQPPCTPSDDFPTDELQYEIFLTDRAGNESNKITTPPITLLCQ